MKKHQTMNFKIKRYCLLAVVVALVACGQEKKKPAFYDNSPSTDNTVEQTDYESTTYSSASGDIVSIPFTEKGAVKYVPVTVNGFGFEMIFDTGCSTTLISVAEARYLYEKGYLTDDDFIGVTQSQIADGSIVENMVVNLKEVVIGGQIRCLDVQATVSANNNAPLLLGNEILNRAAAFAVDNENKTINFKLK